MDFFSKEERFGSEHGQAVIGFAQIRGSSSQKNRGRGQEANHLTPSNTVSNRRKDSGSKCSGILRERPPVQLRT